ncbi:MAG TPA: DinB family protein [Gemmatimonadaceae bacterium]
MHPRIQELLDHLTHHRAELRRAVDGVPAERREQRPAPDRWSVADVLEHLAIVEDRIADGFTKQVAAARASGLGQDAETSPVVPTLDMKRLLDRRRRVTAVEVTHPRGMSANAAWSALEQSRARLRAALLDADGLALGTLTATHPVLGEMNLYQRIAFIGGHEARHAAQIREIGAALDVASVEA